jgi:hypothetical protein
LEVVRKSETEADNSWHCIHCKLNLALTALVTQASIVGVLDEIEAKSAQELTLLIHLKASWIIKVI